MVKRLSPSSCSTTASNAGTFDIFVGRLPADSNKATLEDLARSYNFVKAKILGKSMKKDAQGACKSGFVTFNDMDCARQFIDAYQGKDIFGCGVPLNVRFADGKTRQKLFFGGLPASTTQADLERIAGTYGKVLTSKILSRAGKKVCGFVVFSNEQEAARCIAETANNKCNFNVQYTKGPCGGKNADKQEMPAAKRQRVMEPVVHHQQQQQQPPQPPQFDNNFSPQMVSPQFMAPPSPFMQHNMMPMEPLAQDQFLAPQMMQPMGQYVQDEYGNFYFMNGPPPSPLASPMMSPVPSSGRSMDDQYQQQAYLSPSDNFNTSVAAICGDMPPQPPQFCGDFQPQFNNLNVPMGMQPMMMPPMQNIVQ